MTTIGEGSKLAVGVQLTQPLEVKSGDEGVVVGADDKRWALPRRLLLQLGQAARQVQQAAEGIRGASLSGSLIGNIHTLNPELGLTGVFPRAAQRLSRCGACLLPGRRIRCRHPSRQSGLILWPIQTGAGEYDRTHPIRCPLRQHLRQHPARRLTHHLRRPDALPIQNRNNTVGELIESCCRRRVVDGNNPIGQM